MKNPRRFIKGMVAGILVAILAVAGIPAAWAGEDGNSGVEPVMTIMAPDGDAPLIIPPLEPGRGENPDAVAVVSGRVVDPDDQPVAGVAVNLYSSDTGYGEMGLTGEDGAFRVKIPAGKGYDLFVNTREPGLSLPVVGGFFQDGDGGAKADPGPDGRWVGGVIPEWDQRTLMDIGTGGLANVVVRLMDGSMITGRVLLTDGTPAAETWVDVSADGTGFWAGAVTDETGLFSMTVAPGTGYRITAYPGKAVFEQGFWRAGEDDPLTRTGRDGALVADAAQATLVDASDDVELNILVPKPRTISGRVTDLQGCPASDLVVEAIGGDQNPDGIYYIMGDMKAAAGTVAIDADAAVVKSDSTVAPLIMPNPFSRIWSAVTDKNGQYRLDLPPGKYRVRVNAVEKLYYGGTDWDSATPVDVLEASTDGIDLRVDLGHVISGTIYGLASGETAWIEVYSAAGGMGSFGYAEVMGTGASVSYVVSRLRAAGDFQVIFRSKTSAPEAASGIDSSRNPSDVDFTVSAGETISGVISGVKPGQDVYVSAWTEAGGPWGGFYGWAQAVADESGRATYDIPTLSPVPGYMVQATAGIKVLYHSQTTRADQATRLDLTAGSARTVNFDFSVIRTVTVRGMVEGLEADKRFVCVDAWDEANGAWGYAFSDGNAPFEMEVVTGEYRLAFYASGYAPLWYDAVSGTLVDDMEKAGRLTVTADMDLGTLAISPEFLREEPILYRADGLAAGVTLAEDQKTVDPTIGPVKPAF